MFGEFKVIKKCSITNARVSTLQLANNTLHLPLYMPVGTYGAMRGVEPDELDEEIVLGNTYHLRNLGRNIKEFMGWKKSMLTDSGGFQIQSLPDVSVTDAGVVFGSKLFTPEESMDTQQILGADIMMQLDDVVNPNEPREMHVVAVKRSLDWLERAVTRINASEAKTKTNNENKKRKLAVGASTVIKPVGNQILFPIIQGGLHTDLRNESIAGILKYKPIGIAIGGLSGGENKNDFVRIVHHCCMNLPDGMPRYLMGVGYPEDILVCCALGTDMSDCVYPTRTARFGRVFRDEGDIVIDNRVSGDIGPIDPNCECKTCNKYTRAYLSLIKGTPNYCTLLSIHNLFYMRRLTERIRKSIEDDKFVQFCKTYFTKRYKKDVPDWIINAMKLVNVKIIN